MYNLASLARTSVRFTMYDKTVEERGAFHDELKLPNLNTQRRKKANFRHAERQRSPNNGKNHS